MQVVKSYPDGVFCWVDLASTDPEGSKAFYGGLFGWEFMDVPTDMGTVYSMAQIGGYNVAGLGPMPQNMREQGVPTHWMSYVKHSNVDEIAAKVTAAGGTVLLPPFDVMQSGRMAMAQDPTGATFGVWQPKEHIGAQLVNRPNTLVWNELQTHDLDKAKAFYAAVFGWTYQEDASGYVAALAGDRGQAGMMKIQESWGPVPPNWSVYFMVEDVEGMVARAQELDGKLMVPPSDAGDIGRFAVLQDPQGGVFTVMRFNGPVAPPPGY